MPNSKKIHFWPNTLAFRRPLPPMSPLQFRRPYGSNADSMQSLNYENGKSQQKHATGLWRGKKKCIGICKQKRPLFKNDISLPYSINSLVSKIKEFIQRITKELNQIVDKGSHSKIQDKNLVIPKVWSGFKIKNNGENIETIKVYTL